MIKKKQRSKVKNWIYRIVFFIALAVFVYSGFQLFQIYFQNYQEGQEKSNVTEIAKVPKDPEKEAFTIDWAALRKKNADVIGWIMIPDTDISYPIVQGKDNDYYLTHTFEKRENYAGAIFLDSNAKPNFTDKNTFIYGHNVRHGTMFAEIEKFKEVAFYKAHPYVYIFTPEKNYRSEIVSMYSTDSSSKTYQNGFGSDEQFMDYVNMIKTQADVKRDTKVKETDNLITLSTCSYEIDGELTSRRYVLHAKLVPWTGKYMVEKKK